MYQKIESQFRNIRKSHAIKNPITIVKIAVTVIAIWFLLFTSLITFIFNTSMSSLQIYFFSIFNRDFL